MSRGLATICIPVLVPLPEGVEYTGVQPGTVDLLTFHLHAPERVTAFAVKAGAALATAIAPTTATVSAPSSSSLAPSLAGPFKDSPAMRVTVA